MSFIKKKLLIAAMFLTTCIYGGRYLSAMKLPDAPVEASPDLATASLDGEREIKKIRAAYTVWLQLMRAQIRDVRAKVYEHNNFGKISFFVAFDIDGVLIRTGEDFKAIDKLPGATMSFIPSVISFFNELHELGVPIYIITARPESFIDESGNVIDHKSFLVEELRFYGLCGLTSENLFAMPRDMYQEVLEVRKEMDREKMGGLVGGWKRSIIDHILETPAHPKAYAFLDDDDYNKPTHLMPKLVDLLRCFDGGVLTNSVYDYLDPRIIDLIVIVQPLPSCNLLDSPPEF